MEDLDRTVPRSGTLAERVPCFLEAHGCIHTARHVAAVAGASAELARLFGAGVERATTGAWLHDISAVIPAGARVRFAERYGIPVLPEEARVPMILHQKLSALLARELFGVADEGVLDAIACHTTLRRDATLLDKVVFLADKIAWDQAGTPPYLAELNRALTVSLDAAICVYLDMLWAQRSTLSVIHPWFVAAHEQLCVPASSCSAPSVP